MAENNQKQRQGGIGRPFPKGQSGNPGGRPKVAQEIRDLAIDCMGPKAITRLVTLMHSTNGQVSVRAAEALLDRGYGRPVQGMELSGKAGKAIEYRTQQCDLSRFNEQELAQLEVLMTKNGEKI